MTSTPLTTSAPSTSGTSPPAPVATSTLTQVGGAVLVAAGVLRTAASFVPSDDPGPALEGLYLAIDLSLLVGVVAAMAAEPAGRTRLGLVGFVLGLAGAGLLIGPSPSDPYVDHEAIGAVAVSVGFALLAVAWHRDAWLARWATAALVAAPVVGVLAAGAASTPGLVASGVLFGIGLVGFGIRVART